MEYRRVPLDRIRTDPGQVRRTFNQESIEGLAASITEVGMLHPLIVSPPDEQGFFTLLSGERRLRAARLAGEREVFVGIASGAVVNPTQLQLIENLQREDLNPLERARAIKQFMDQENLSKAAVASKLGVPRTTVTDWLDVLEIDPRHQAALLDNFNGGDSPLSLSHVAEARALGATLGSTHIRDVLLDAVLEYKLSKAETRQVAQLVRTHADLSVRDAIRQVRRHSVEGDDEEAEREREKEKAARRDQSPVHKMVAGLDRLRSVLADLIGGVLKRVSREERHQVVDSLRRMRNWIDDVLSLAEDLDRREEQVALAREAGRPAAQPVAAAPGRGGSRQPFIRRPRHHDDHR